jgi:urease subunit beta
MTNELLVLSDDGRGRKSAHVACNDVHPVTYPNTKGYMPDTDVAVGGVVLCQLPIGYNLNRKVVRLKVRNTGDRPIQVGSHFHFFEVNRYLSFRRKEAFGTHLNIPATTAIRFEPGDEREVELVTFGGKCRIVGFNGLTSGYAGGEDTPTYFPVRIKAFSRAAKYRFKSDDCDCGNRNCSCGCNDGNSCDCNEDSCDCGDGKDCGCSIDGNNCECEEKKDGEPKGCECGTK